MHEWAALASRRAFLRFLAGSPLYAALAGCGKTDEGAAGAPSSAGAVLPASGDVIGSPEQAINVFDLEAAARRALPPAHFGYLQTGVNGDLTLRANEAAFAKFYLRPRRLVDVSRIETSVGLFGATWPTPIILAPAGSQQAFHPDGELATARAARARTHLQILSTMSSTSVEDVTQARGAPVWYQLYPTGRWDVTERLLARAEATGSSVVVLTVDIPAGTENRETLERAIRTDPRDCTQCHGAPDEGLRRKPMFQGTDLGGGDFSQAALTWPFLRRLRDRTRMKVVVKGIVTEEDAARCLEYGADGLIVSNHGGRADESGRGAIESLPEVVAAVGGRVPVLMDSGIRRGPDILKALGLGATAVCVGRPYLWGLGAFGQAGVERALELLSLELQVAMQFAGTPTLRAITPSLVGTA